MRDVHALPSADWRSAVMRPQADRVRLEGREVPTQLRMRAIADDIAVSVKRHIRQDTAEARIKFRRRCFMNYRWHHLFPRPCRSFYRHNLIETISNIAQPLGEP
jgi:hypothetical protein